jgi:hypothetical protein
MEARDKSKGLHPGPGKKEDHKAVNLTLANICQNKKFKDQRLYILCLM